ncbi:MAG TPA: CAP domain-containing protein [Pirellulaceae bacterium]
MKATYWIATVLCASVALADNTAPTAASTGGSTQSEASAGRPLHRHPTLFGMLTRNNNIRRRNGLRPHRMNPALAAAAQDHANYMARTGQFSHYTNGSPQSRANKYGFGGGVLENIATGGGPDTAFSMWQNSGAHYASIVSNTADAGFGYAVGPGGATYFVGIYGTGSPGAGETEEQIAQYLEEEKAAAAEKLAAEKLAAENLAAKNTAAENDPNVKPASANVDAQQKPANEVKPAAATDSVSGN